MASPAPAVPPAAAERDGGERRDGDLGSRLLAAHDQLAGAIASHVLAGAAAECAACAASQTAFARAEEVADEIYNVGEMLRRRHSAARDGGPPTSARERGLLEECRELKMQVQEITDSRIELLQHVEALSTAERALATELSTLRTKQEDSDKIIQEQQAIIQMAQNDASHPLSPRPPLSHDASYLSETAGSVCGEGLELIDEACEELDKHAQKIDGCGDGAGRGRGTLDGASPSDGARDKDKQIERLSRQLAEAEERLRVLSKELVDERKAQKKQRVR